MKNITKISAILLASAGYAMNAHATFDQIIDQLPTELERDSARAAWQTYNDLITNAGCTDSMRLPAVGQANGATTCSGNTYQLFKNVRAIIQTGNELTNSGPTLYSLGLDKRSLGFALRWDAAEEYAAQGSLTSNYLRGQMSSLNSRLTALRMGASGFNLHASNSGYSTQPQLAYGEDVVTGGGASAEEEDFSQLGGFINYAGGKGSKEATDLEDAFDFSGNQFNAGLDYRIDTEWVIGALVSHINQTVDFDKSKSVVSGNVEASGVSVFPFAMYQLEHFYVSGSLGYQQVHFDSLRAIRYPSLNPDVPSPNTQAKAATDATTSSYFVGAGYNVNYKKLSFGPFINFNSAKTSINEFTEKDVKNLAFDLVVDKQNLSLRSTSIGATVRYTFTPSFAVITPYATYELVKQTDDKINVISAHYVNAVSNADVFGISGDALDKYYSINTIGVSSVLIGAYQKTAGGHISGGLQGFLQYKQLSGLEHYKSNLFELGLRYEF